MNPDVPLLMNKARESLAAAEMLCGKGYHDFAAARAYYAMFYAAEALLLERGLAFSSHGAVQGAFGKEFSKTGALDAKFHRYLLDAQDSRNQGDYGVGTPVTEPKAKETLNWAAEFIAAAAQLLAGKPNN